MSFAQLSGFFMRKKKLGKVLHGDEDTIKYKYIGKKNESQPH